jgi:trans-aconitate methyltransferase
MKKIAKSIARSVLGFGLRVAEGMGIGAKKYECLYDLETDKLVNGKASSAWLGSYYGDNKFVIKKRSVRLAREIAKLRPKTILELGCGFGYVLNEVSKKTHVECNGIDMQKNAIALGSGMFPGIKLEVANCLKHVPDKKYDVVFTSSFFSYTNEAIARKCIERYARFAKTIVICEVVAKNLNCGQYFETRISNRNHDYYSMLKKAGFDVIKEIKPDSIDCRTILIARKH